MTWLLYVLLGVLVFWLWFFLGSGDHCPECGRGLDDDWAYPGSKRRRCRGCGWSDE